MVDITQIFQLKVLLMVHAILDTTALKDQRLLLKSLVLPVLSEQLQLEVNRRIAQFALLVDIVLEKD